MGSLHLSVQAVKLVLHRRNDKKDALCYEFSIVTQFVVSLDFRF
jgi:hypothetical protein